MLNVFTPKREQSSGEEIANSLAHGLAVVAALVGIPFLILHAVRLGDPAFIVGVSVFSLTILLLYMASSIHHGLPAGRAKRVFLTLDHAAIYLLIAGTYTPFTLGVLRGAWGWTLFGLVWGIAAIGIALKAFGRGTHPVVSTGLYLLMGWLIVIAIKPLVASVPTAGVVWLVAGGLCYTLGVVFFTTGSMLRFGHLIWHLFVVAGTVCHYFAVLWYASGDTRMPALIGVG